MVFGADWPPLSQAASQMTQHAEAQSQMVREMLTELEDFRKAMEVRFQELTKWHERLTQREQAIDHRQIEWDQKLTALTIEIRSLQADIRDRDSQRTETPLPR